MAPNNNQSVCSQHQSASPNAHHDLPPSRNTRSALLRYCCPRSPRFPLRRHPPPLRQSTLPIHTILVHLRNVLLTCLSRHALFELQYLHDYAGVNVSIGLTTNHIVNLSNVFGIAIGADVSLDTSTT
ncbi:hypothetical protein GUJ93_ZPchr0002g24294 [Zizania palustris]|uniref:Uncharacterized protein n=1 Tax=Zizania palustris TaxID=103762 RepID=A0A8J5V9R1_ZIZPA|nr:hypothetical protein GUJ93_ZPchr0002g24294 [Zizania palustris]